MRESAGVAEDPDGGEGLFPQEHEWHPVSPRLITLRRGCALAVLLPLMLAAGVLLGVFVASWLGLVVALALAATAAWSWVVIGRVCRSWGYAERADDLLVRHGLLVRRLSVVPYGRMQFVDVTAGPLERRMQIATVHLHTAAAASNAVIPGLPPAEAARLRDRLAALGEARAAGL